LTEHSRPLVGVTGSSGYLGRTLVDHLRAAGFDVVEYRRGVDAEANPEVARDFDLARPPEVGTFRGVTCLVHAAWDLHQTDPVRAWETNVEGSRQVLAAAVAAGIERVVFVSSMSAYFGTRQDYGLMKLAVERMVLESDHVVVRPGLVYGNSLGGMAQTLSKLARLPVIPTFRGARLFTLHVDDFVAAVATLVEAEDVPSSVIGLAHETPTPFREIMLAMAATAGNSKNTLPIPWHPVLGVLRVLEQLNVPLPVRSDSLLGLVRSATNVPGLDVAERLGLSFRKFSP
jgi:nucleoside-diphosphate-sugar epimerase